MNKSESPATGGKGYHNQHLTPYKGRKKSKHIQHSATRNAAHAAIVDVRQTEMILARAFFRAHPNTAFSRPDLVDALGKPLSHVCRIVFNLIEENTVEVVGRATNPQSGRTVEVVRLKPRTEFVGEQSLFDRTGGGSHE
jgi:hypothetical protein